MKHIETDLPETAGEPRYQYARVRHCLASSAAPEAEALLFVEQPAPMEAFLSAIRNGLRAAYAGDSGLVLAGVEFDGGAETFLLYDPNSGYHATVSEGGRFRGKDRIEPDPLSIEGGVARGPEELDRRE